MTHTHALSAIETTRGAYGELGVGERYNPLIEEEELPFASDTRQFSPPLYLRVKAALPTYHDTIPLRIGHERPRSLRGWGYGSG